MSKENKISKFLKSLNVKQKIWFFVGLFFFVVGFVALVLYSIEILLNISPASNPLLKADNVIKGWTSVNFGFLVWGIIAFILGAFIDSIVISVSSKTEDREKEKLERREARLKQMASFNKTEEENKEVVVAEVPNEVK